MGKRKTTEEFIEQARKVHGDRFDYSEVNYVNNNTKVCIICKKCGTKFWQNPKTHLNGHNNCPNCHKNGIKYTTNIFIEKAKNVHGDKYDYSKVDYINSHTKVCIICPEHGEFWQTPQEHLIGRACPKCWRCTTKEDFIITSSLVHKNKYNYSKVEYIDSKTKVCIICPIHGEFWQVPSCHIAGSGCPSCKNEKHNERERLSIDDFIDRCNKTHVIKYDYSKVNYVNNKEKICIICPKHGEFWQIASNHLKGYNCPKCGKKFSKLEEEIYQYLMDNNIDFIHQKTFKWLKNKKHLYLDFYLPEYKIAIECQGGQHFFSTKHFGGEIYLEKIKENDTIKKNLCEENGITLLYYSNLHIEYPYEVFEDKEELLKEILKNNFIHL